MKQSDIFLASEGAAWIARNRDKPRDGDPVLKAMKLLDIKPKSVLEIGCGDGWRLDKLRSHNCSAYGIDPGSKSSVGPIWRDTATRSRFPSNTFDCVIFGFCLYLVDREDLFTAVAEADRVLQDGGWLIIHDFLPPIRPFARPYEHKEGVMSYHMNYALLWLTHPWYSLKQEFVPSIDESITVLRKNIDNAFEVRP